MENQINEQLIYLRNGVQVNSIILKIKNTGVLFSYLYYWLPWTSHLLLCSMPRYQQRVSSYFFLKTETHHFPNDSISD